MRCGERLCVVVVLMLTALLHLSTSWRTDRRPRLFGSKLKLKSLTPGKRVIQRRLVHFHNLFRSKVKPTASNMLAMSYSRAAAVDAQRWAEACQLLVHNEASDRQLRRLGTCGQNIFVSTHQVPWFFAVQTWWLEKNNFTYDGAHNDLDVVGHYTQMVWYSSHKLGCGLAYCADAKPKPFYNYVCNYCPIGNHLGRLWRPYDTGRPCSACEGHCKAKKLCTNSCPFADQWINCKSLKKAFPRWLCGGGTPEGKERLRNCGATCRCKDKITYP